MMWIRLEVDESGLVQVVDDPLHIRLAPMSRANHATSCGASGIDLIHS